MSLFDIFNKKNIGETLGSLMDTAKEQASGLTKATPGGVGGLVGAGALGALLGSFMSKGALQNAALVGAGAVAWNFYQKWSQSQKESQPAEPAPVQQPVAAVAPGVSAATGLSLQQLAGALVDAVQPAALICVDSLCSAEGARLGRSVQFSDTGLYPAQADHAKHLDAASLGVPVLAAGIPTLMESDEGADLVVTPRALDSVIAHGSALLAGAINRALQPRLSLTQLCWLTG